MTLRLKIITPLKATQADLDRRQRRYLAYARSGTHVEVCNIDGPETLDTLGDILFSEHAVFQEGIATDPAQFDAILVDCVFDPALRALREQGFVPSFGPMQLTLPLISLVAPNFAFIARTHRQIEWLIDRATEYGYADRLISAHALDITYEESRKPPIFSQALKQGIQRVVDEDDVRAIFLGSTTWAVENEVAAAARNVHLFLPGMFALQTLQHLSDRKLLIPAGGIHPHV